MNVYTVFKTGFLTFLMMSIGFAQAVCIYGEEYQTPTGRKIYLLGDVHINSSELSQQEQEAFIGAAKKRGAVCIVEDIYGYEGNDEAIRQAIDNVRYKALFYQHDAIKDHESALSGLAHQCLINGIPCFNAECRYALKLISAARMSRSSLEKIYNEVDKVVEEERNYDDGILTDYYEEALSLCAPLKGINSEITYRINKKPYKQHVVDAFGLLDIRILHNVHTLLQNEDDKRDIFIFAGMNHIINIIPALEEYLGCKTYRKNKLGYACKVIAIADQLLPERAYSYFNFYNKQEGQEFINKHRVDIAEFFKQEHKKDIAFKLRKMRRRLNQEKKNKHKKLAAVVAAAALP